MANAQKTFAVDKVEYIIRPTSEVSLTEMRGHPVILLGAYSNEWTLRLVNSLRYRLTEQPQMEIYDSVDPSVHWARPAQLAYEEADDYAIVARFCDQLTGNLVVIAGGIGKNGTEAAAQFITSSRYLNLLDTPRSRDWANKNIEFVIRIKVVEGKAGPPWLESVYVW